MYFDDDSLYVWERHTLPRNWKEVLMSHVPVGPTAPIVSAIQEVVARHDDLSIFLWQVQELALSLSGRDRPRFHAAYDVVAARLTDRGGSSWPLTFALREHLHENDHVTQLTTRLSSCDGEWRALLRLVDSGWLPLERQRGTGPDWVVSKNGIEVPVEVKTKLPLASAAGRLTRYFIGLGMLPKFDFLRELDFSWYVGDNTTDQVVRSFIESFMAHLDSITSHGREGKLAMITLASSDEKRFRLCVRGPLSLWVELAEGTRRVVFEATPARFNDHIFTGGGSARSSHGDATELPGVMKAFGRLLREKQSYKRNDETLLMLVWHMPHHALSYDPDLIHAYWRSWCEEHHIVRGALLPITAGGGNPQPLFVTEAAARLDLGAVHA